ncbi:MAG: hypothetical protein P3C10_07485 [Gemmatimonadota bacterium]|nr:hypothetical protein [Gemmatimonadota bacterium]
MRSSFIFAMLAAVALPALSRPAAAQVPTRTLAKPVAEYAEPFSQLSAVRELKDGRLLVVDSRDKLVQLINFATNSAAKVGREGSGPGEYGVPTQLFAMPGDSSVIFDPLNQRYLTVHPDGKPGASFRVGDESAGPPPGAPRPPQGPRPPAGAPGGAQVIRIGGLGFGMPRASDARGRLYFEGGGLSMGPNGPVTADTAPIVRYDRATKAVDTLAWVRLPKNNASVKSSGSGGNQRMEVRIGGRTPYPSRDGWTVLANGTLVIVRVADYHVELVSPTRVVTRGPAVAHTPVAVGNAEKQAYRDAAKNTGGIAIMRTDGGPGGAQTRASSGPPPFEEPTEWPAAKPPFIASEILPTPTGEIWVARNRPASEAVPWYDVFSPTGSLTGRVLLPTKTRVVGFGAGGAVYTVRLDEDDLQYLQRFRR